MHARASRTRGNLSGMHIDVQMQTSVSSSVGEPVCAHVHPGRLGILMSYNFTVHPQIRESLGAYVGHPVCTRVRPGCLGIYQVCT